MNRNRAAGSMTALNLFPIAALSGASATTSSAVDVSEYDGDLRVAFSCTAMGGSSTPTCTFTMTECETSGGTFTAVSGVEVAFTAAGLTTVTLNTDKRMRYVKVVATLTGTSPTCSASAVGVAIARG